MHNTTFLTKNFTREEFTTGWSYLTDKSGQPCHGITTVLDDQIICESKEKLFSLNLLLEVPEFGKVMLRTDVVSSDKEKHDLLSELIKGRIAQIKKEIYANKNLVPNSYKKRLLTLTKQKASLKKLSKAMFLGEEIVFFNSKKKLQRKIKNGQANIMLGGQAFGIEKDQKYKDIHEKTFTLGIAPIYFFLLKNESKEKINWELTDKAVEFLVKTNRPIKGHPFVWLHKYARPDWMLTLSFPELKAFLKEHIITVINRYKDKIKIWDIVNEMPAEDANGFDLTLEQTLEITKMTSQLVKKLQPEAERIINFSEIFGAHSYIHEKPSVPPLYFLKRCVEYGVEFEGIGLQFYMGMKKEFVCRELLNISQSVDDFLVLKKNLHFSELGWPSKHDIDPDCFFSSDHPEVAGRWHRGWDEALQAEFLEKIYTIFASKDKTRDITWWDITDNGVHEDIGSRFIPFSGLTRRDYSPKPALKALQKFKEQLNSKAKL